MAHVDASADNKLPHIARWKRGRRFPAMLQAGLFTGVFTAMIVFAASAVWWMESLGTARDMNARPDASTRSQSVAANNLRQDTTVSRSTSRNAENIAHVHAASAVKEQSRTMTAPEIRTDPAADDSDRKPLLPSHRETATLPVPSAQKKQASGSEKKRTPGRNAGVKDIQRADEIGRLRAKAFSETRKDRLGSTTPDARTPAPEVRLEPPPSSTRSPGDTSKRAGRTGIAQAFNQCKRKESFLQQEKCKWEICAGKWGQNGCPAYRHEIASY